MSQENHHEEKQVCIRHKYLGKLFYYKQKSIIDIIDIYELDVFSSKELIVEFQTVLEYPHLKKYKVNIPGAVKLLKEITTQQILTYPIKNYIPLDVNDNYIIALALQTNAGYVTSGDKHILHEKGNLEIRFKKLKIISKAEFENMFPL